MASGEIALAPCPACSKLITVEPCACPHCDVRITEAIKIEMLQVARFQVTDNRTKNGLWIAETRKHEVIQAARVQGTNNLWEWLGGNGSKLRDLALAGAAGTYAFGFIIWSIHALRNNLGLLPALDSQYIIAGLVPIIILVLAVAPCYVVIKRIKFNANMLPVLVVINIIFVCLHFFFPQEQVLVRTGVNILQYIFTVLTLAVSLSVYAGSPSSTRFRIPIPVFRILSYLPTLVLMITAIFFSYAVTVYPNIPQTFGGAKPRCAYLDVDPSKISAASKNVLFSTDGDSISTINGDSPSMVMRSDKVDVYFVGDNWLLVKRASATEPIASNTAQGELTAEQRDSDTYTYEIDRDAINAIIWC
jgi:hypothetical protein